MGYRLEKVYQNVEQAEHIQETGLIEGRKDGNEIREIKGILDSMDMDVDEDILNAIRETREASKSEAAAHMDSEVHGTLEQGYMHANEAIQEGNEQAQKSRQAAQEFSRVSGVSEFGRGTAERSRSNAESLGSQFEQAAESARQRMEQSEQEFSRIRDEILG